MNKSTMYELERIQNDMKAEKMTELEMLREWKKDALETMADDDRAYREQALMLKEMHVVIGKVADALHEANLCISGYVEIKNEKLPKTKRQRKV